MLLGASWAGLRRLRELDLSYAAELRQQGGPGGGPLNAILPSLRSLSLQARSVTIVPPKTTRQQMCGRCLRSEQSSVKQGEGMRRLS